MSIGIRKKKKKENETNNFLNQMFCSYFKAILKCSSKQIMHFKKIPIRCYVRPSFDISDKFSKTKS